MLAELTLDDLADEVIWVAWQQEDRIDTKNDTKKPTKVLYQADAKRAKSDDDKTWGTRKQASRWAKQLDMPYDIGGVGVVLTYIDDNSNKGTSLAGIDLDTCIDDNGKAADWAQEVIDRFASYTEISPSGTGVKVFFLYKNEWLPELRQLMGPPEDRYGKVFKRYSGTDHPPAIELYLGKRYFAVTDNNLPNGTRNLRLVDEADLRWLLTETGPKFVGNGHDREHGGGHDNSRSSYALEIGRAAQRAGKSFDEMCAAIQDDPRTRDWYHEKGTKSGGRELQRIWDKGGPNPEIGELNEQYAVVLAGGKACILREAKDEYDRDIGSLMSISSFHNWLANKDILLGKKAMPLSKYWFSHPSRRQYQGIVFAPHHDNQAFYNLWRGFACESREGDCSLFLDHIRDNICKRDKTLYQWVVAWCAQIVQQPDQKMGTSLVLRGAQGTGKTIFGKVIGSLLCDHYVLVADPRYITGRFNSHLVSCLLLHADEGFWAGDHTAEGKLKDLVTGNHHFIEMKGYEPIRVRNYVRLLVTGNPNWLVPAGMQERRFAVLDMGIEHQEDHAYFKAIEDQMDSGGREALLHYLMNFDTSQVNLRTIPKTGALLEQKIASMSSEQQWWFDVLNNGRLLVANYGAGNSVVPRKVLYESYIDHSNKVGVRRKSIETALGIFPRRMIPSLQGDKYTFTNSEGKDYRDRGYVFPFLEMCRKLFDEDLGLNQEVDWDE